MCNGEPISKAQQMPGALAPGICLLSRGAIPRGSGVAVRGNSLIVFSSEGLWLWGGSAGAGTWGQVSIGTFLWVRGTSAGAVDGVCPLQEMTRQEHHIWSGMLEQGPDRQRAPDCCSGGVSSINGASESRCSHVGPAQWSQQGLQHFRHWSSLRATGLHEVGLTV